jgi:hypothetical protein
MVYESEEICCVGLPIYASECSKIHLLLINNFDFILKDIDPERLFILDIGWGTENSIFALKYLNKKYNLLIYWDTYLKIFSRVRLEIEGIFIELPAWSVP